MSSMVMPYPQQPPYPLSRPSTPRPSAPLSAPPTPITPTHLLPAAMERARSTESVVSGANQAQSDTQESKQPREPKATRLKYEWEHLESSTSTPSDTQGDGDKKDSDRMDVDEDVAGPSGYLGADLGEPVSTYKEEQAQREEAIASMDSPAVEKEAELHPLVWGMPKWGREPERKEVARGVRLLGVEELPRLMEAHSLIDTPSSIMFPWLHGISDDGQKGRDMANFFGHSPPFEPPPYRGLSVMFCPPHHLDHQVKLMPNSTSRDHTAPYEIPHHKGSETDLSSSSSYYSTGTTIATSAPSLGNSLPSPMKSPLKSLPEVEDSQDEKNTGESDVTVDVAMHPCNTKRLSPMAVSKGFDEEHHPLPCESTDAAAAEQDVPSSAASDASSEMLLTLEDRPSCILFNALHVHDVFELRRHHDHPNKKPRFRPARLPEQINLRNLNIQQIKYSSVSDIVLYCKSGLGPGVLQTAEEIAQAQEDLYQQRSEEFYSHVKDSRNPGEGSSEPIRYGVWVVVEPFHKLEKKCPELVLIDSQGRQAVSHLQTDLFDREAKESRAMTRGSEVVEGFWVGNDCDMPGHTPDGVGASVRFDLCLKASECAEMPSASTLSMVQRKLLELDQHRGPTEEATQAQTTFNWTASPATLALRNLLTAGPASNEVPAKRTASPSAEDRSSKARALPMEYQFVGLECSGSCRTITGQTRNLNTMTDRVVELVYFLRKIIEGRDNGKKRKVLVHCQDGYTESSIVVLSYIMSSLSISLPEAFLHLQITGNRSFFVYPADKPLLRKIDARLANDRKAKAVKFLSATSISSSSVREAEERHPSSSPRWRSWGMTFGNKKEPANGKIASIKEKDGGGAKLTVDAAKEMLAEYEEGGSLAARQARVWFDDRRFDGFPSRILPFLYLGNLEHAGNADMLVSLGIDHVVSVGESLLGGPPNPHGSSPDNTLASAARAGKIKVLDLMDVRDDGNDPLRPVIAHACEWIEAARQSGGKILVHCRVGVSRSASIVIAYMMQHEKLGLMDAYMTCRARRLNVLIQPNLRFFHELFGWEVELAKREAEAGKKRRYEAEQKGVRDPHALKLIEDEPRRIVHSWPSFCRDLYCLNRRFLCN
ncbi:hypothetical protein L198_01565 [Cryptococcus wingfieldii CBS 7118]|uniref:Uncharacterized protein n=1 Tax=Cryptococcus wingfieldii CBS 7118 TaxID=1295528 RepID=A0A1E3JZY5_9TREE|nr:hypothetical protein L198_01565 [Cryptococcus wingfieldii CBS 7118]ODO06333.1 hypothetical protein L198_01565 [Cryptococcus wingfieldii CBS 7118]